MIDKEIVYSSLPDSNSINKNILLQLFSNTTNSYKYLYFMAIMKLLLKQQFQQRNLPMVDIATNMLLIAYYPHIYFKLSFGVQDNICNLLDQIQSDKDYLLLSRKPFLFLTKEGELIKILYSKSKQLQDLMRYVPYRLIYPFFSHVLKGESDAKKNKYIESLAIERFDDVRPLYCINKSADEVVLHPAWMEYIHDNYELIWGYVKWEWLSYMQKKNPSVPNIQAKLFPIATKPEMNAQRKFWRIVTQQQKLHCIYSMQAITSDNISLDHFVPWTFVAHNQLWNLIPTVKSVNSSKSNNLPSLEKYFNSYVEIQYQGLRIYRDMVDSSTWQRTIEPYQVDLRISGEEIADFSKFRNKMKSTVYPLVSLAENIGFSSNWEFGGF